jgi:hypothetical protein
LLSINLYLESFVAHVGMTVFDVVGLTIAAAMAALLTGRARQR